MAATEERFFDFARRIKGVWPVEREEAERD